LVRRRDERSDELGRAGAEIVQGDLLDLASVERAAEGCEAVGFIYSVAPGLVEATAIMAAATRESGAKLVVNLAHLNTAPHAPSPHTRRHWLAEEVLGWSGVPACFLRAAVFHENIARNAEPGIREKGELRLPLGAPDTPIPLIAGADVAAAMARVLTHPAPHVGEVYSLVGEVQTPTGIAEALGRATGRTIAYRPASQETWAKHAEATGVADNPTASEHLNKLWWTLAHPDPALAGRLRQSGLALEALGVRPTTFAAFADTRYSEAVS